MIVVFHEDAQTEIDAAIWHYSAISETLGDAFRDEAERAVERIRERPDAWKLLARGLRRYRLNRFPYGLVYRVQDGTITIYAVMHLKRRPGYWRDGFKESGPL